MSSDREKETHALTAALLVILLVAAVIVTYGYYSIHPSSAQQRTVIGNLQLRSTSVDMTDANLTSLSLNFQAVVYNPNGFGATLDTASYSVYANGHYVGSGKTDHSYDVASESSQTLIFPVSVGWKPALNTMGNYVLSLGRVTWEVNGTADVKIGGLSLTVPFQLSTG